MPVLWPPKRAAMQKSVAEIIVAPKLPPKLPPKLEPIFFLNKIRPNLENMCVIDVPPVPNSQPHRPQFRLPVHKFRRHFNSISEISAPFRLHFGPTRAKDRWTGRGGCRPEATAARGSAGQPWQHPGSHCKTSKSHTTETKSTKRNRYTFNKIIKK